MWLLLWSLACSSPPPAPPTLEALDHQLTEAVAALREAEAPLLRAALQEALERGDLQQARALVTSLPADQVDAGLREALGRDGPAPRDLARFRGITLDHAVRALQIADHFLVDRPDWTRATAGADAAVAEQVPSPLPPLAAPPEDLPGAAARLASWAAHAPRPEVLGTWVEHALSTLDHRSRVAWPAELQAFEAHHAGVYVGVGVELADREGAVVVRWPRPGSPAFEGGVHQGDLIARVDDLVVAELQPPRAEKVADALRGEAGSTVRIAVLRDGGPLQIEVQRQPVEVETVTGWTRTEGNRWDPWLDREAGVAFVRVDTFRPTTEAAFDALLEPILDEVRAVVLDLRGCPGGDLDAAVQIADRFIDAGPLVELEGRVLPPPPPEGLVAWNHAVPGHALEGVPVAVLVDSRTASSAEVLAGALQARAGAVVIGAPTFGKGSSQRLEGDPDLGLTVQVTNLRWRIPGGEVLEGNGIAPDVVLPLGAAGTYQIDAMRRRRAWPRVHADGTPMTPEIPAPRADLPVLQADPHVVRARRILQDR